MRVGVALQGGLLPQVAPAFELSGGWSRRWLRVDARATYMPPQTRALGVEGGSVRYQAWSVGARGCVVLRPGVVAVPLCLGTDAGAVHGRSAGLAPSGRDLRPFVDLGLSVGADWEVAARVSFWARLESGATVLRPDFAIDGLGSVHRAEVWRAVGAIGLAYAFR